MYRIEKQSRIMIKDTFIRLGTWLLQDTPERSAMIELASMRNPWFTKENVHHAIEAIGSEFLDEGKLNTWLSNYQNKERVSPKRVGLILAGNIPLVGFHDFLCVLMAGHDAIVKLSDRDDVLLPMLVEKMSKWDSYFSEKVNIGARLGDFDAVIATGSNQSSRYFERYFGKYPHIIRKNRNAVAVLTGDESTEDFQKLGHDIFSYFGLGCRNVSKLYIPTGFDFAPLLDSLDRFGTIANHNKYRNNFDYNLATYIINLRPYMANSCLILVESPDIASRISVLNYEYYEDLEVVERKLADEAGKIQCIVSKKAVLPMKTVEFGNAQKPCLSEYADGLDTMNFLESL